jgi:hypothetical protein
MIIIPFRADLAISIPVLVYTKPRHVTHGLTAAMVIESVIFLTFHTPPVDSHNQTISIITKWSTAPVI